MGFSQWMQNNEGVMDKFDQWGNKINDLANKYLGDHRDNVWFPGTAWQAGANVHIGELAKQLQSRGYIVLSPDDPQFKQKIADLYFEKVSKTPPPLPMGGM